MDYAETSEKEKYKASEQKPAQLSMTSKDQATAIQFSERFAYFDLKSGQVVTVVLPFI